MLIKKNGIRIIIYGAVTLVCLAMLGGFISYLRFDKNSPRNLRAGDYITNPQRTDGFGAQFQTLIYSVIFAEMNNLQFVYTPFKSMEHNYDNDPDFLAKKEKLINFKDNFENADYKLMVKDFDLQYFITYFEDNLQQCLKSKSLEKIRTIFRVNKPQDFFNNGKFNIAIHIRRLNIHDNRIEGADVSNEKFLEIINLLKTKYSDKDYQFHIYSQGNPDDFKPFADNTTVFHIDESIEDTFTGMVLANALVLSPSSFSYTAALLSNGDVYYQKFWHPPLPNWIDIS
jgi:hypothetical protein